MGGIIIMLVHGIVSPLFFVLCREIFYFRKTRNLAMVILSRKSKLFLLLCVFLVLYNIGFPFLPGVVRESFFLFIMLSMKFGIVLILVVFILGGIFLIKFFLCFVEGKFDSSIGFNLGILIKRFLVLLLVRLFFLFLNKS
jgi:hypothetical protein